MICAAKVFDHVTLPPIQWTRRRSIPPSQEAFRLRSERSLCDQGSPAYQSPIGRVGEPTELRFDTGKLSYDLERFLDGNFSLLNSHDQLGGLLLAHATVDH